MNLTNLPIQQLGPVFSEGQSNRITSVLGGQGGVLAGQAVYQDPTTGTYLPTSTAAGGNYQFRGLALEPAAQNQGFDLMQRGFVGGFDLSALAFDALIYLSDTPGLLSSTPGTTSVVVGRVCASTDFDVATGKPSKVLFIESLMAGNH